MCLSLLLLVDLFVAFWMKKNKSKRESGKNKHLDICYVKHEKWTRHGDDGRLSMVVMRLSVWGALRG